MIDLRRRTAYDAMTTLWRATGLNAEMADGRWQMWGGVDGDELLRR